MSDLTSNLARESLSPMGVTTLCCALIAYNIIYKRVSLMKSSQSNKNAAATSSLHSQSHGGDGNIDGASLSGLGQHILYQDECCVVRKESPERSNSRVHLVVRPRDLACPTRLSKANGHNKLQLGALMVGAAKAADALGLQTGGYRLLVHGDDEALKAHGLTVHLLSDST